jgi:hypothetical protein
MALDPETQRAIEEIVSQIRELTLVMRNLGNTMSAIGDEEIHRLGRQLNRTTEETKKATRLLDQFGQEIKSSTEVIEDETRARTESTRATEDSTREERRRQQENFVYRRRERSAFRDLTQELSTTRGMMSRFQESVLSVSDNSKYQASMLLLGHGFEALGKSAMGLARDLYAGQISIRTTAKSLETFTDIMGTAMMAIGAASVLLGPFKILGAAVAAVGGAMQALGSIIGLVAGQAEKQFSAFQQLQKTGGALGVGLEELRKQAQDLGFGVDELDRMISMVGENATALAIFRGSVAAGAREMANIADVVEKTGLRKQFMALGLDIQDINDSLAGYIEIQNRSTRVQNLTTNQAVRGLQAYIKETNILTALTGKTRREQEDQARQAMAVEQFRFRINQLRAQGDEASIQEANRLTGIFRTLASTGAPGLAQAFAEMTTGFVGPNSIGAFLIGNAEAMQISQDRTIGAADAVERLRNAIAPQLVDGAFGTLAAVGQFGQVLGQQYGELSDFVLQAENLGARTRSQAEIQADMLANTEAMVQSIINATESNRASRNALQDFVALGLTPATKALEGLAKIVNNIVNRFTGQDRPTTLPSPDSAIMREMTEIFGMAPLTTKDAARSRVEPITRQGAARNEPGGSGGGLIQRMLSGAGFEPGRSGPRNQTPSMDGTGNQPMSIDDLIDFRGGLTGNPENLNRLDPEFRARLLAMAQDYVTLTGKKITLESGHRSPEQNRAVGGVLGSNHLQGRAADLGSETVRELVRHGLLSKHGFQHNPNKLSHISDTGFRYGGIAEGPKSGYRATLHGTEAIIPMGNNERIPIEMPDFDRALSRQTDMLGMQIQKLDEVVSVMRSQLGVSSRILQVTQN